jgi:hypothetical protein
MAAFAFHHPVPTRYYIRLDSVVAERETDHALLLDAARAQTNSQTAVIYAFQPEILEVRAVTARTNLTAQLKDVGVTFSEVASRWLESLPGTTQGTPAGQRNFEKFPEALQYQVKRLVVVPLRTENSVFGFLTLGRLVETPFQQTDIDVANRAGRLLTAVLERDSLQRKLVERKLIERAKGILQQRRSLSEEQAYLLLRNNSRRRRITMASLAKEIIELTLASTGPARHWLTA